MKKRMVKFFRQNKIEIALLLFSISISFLFLSFLVLLGETKGDVILGFPILGNDSSEYYTGAVSLLDHGVFSLNQDLFPESFRVPGYSFFIAVVLKLFGSIWAVSIAQIFLHGLSVVILYKISSLCSSKRLSVFIATFFVLEPVMLFHSFVVLSESLFIFLFLFSLYLFLLYNESYKKSLGLKFFSGVLLGLAILTRTIAQFLPLFLVVYFLVLNFDKINYKKLSLMGVYLAGIFMILFPWMLRNQNLFGSFAISSSSSYNLLHYNIPLHYSQKNNVSYDDAYDIFEIKELRELGNYKYKSLENSNIFKEKSFLYLKNNFSSYSFFHLIKTTPFFLTDGLRGLVAETGLYEIRFEDMSGALMRGDWEVVYSYFAKDRISSLLFFIGFSFWLIVSLLLFSSLRLVFYVKNREVLGFFVLCFLLVLYFAVLTGPVSNARYRLPAEPFMFILAFWSLFNIKIFKKWKD